MFTESSTRFDDLFIRYSYSMLSPTVLMTGAWSVLLVFAVLAFKRERKREPGFIPPSDGISYANVHDRLPAAEDPYADKHEAQTGYNQPTATGYERYGYDQTPGNENDAFGRPSMDAYGAFEDDRGRSQVGDETSRTMQLAYTDPCE